MAMPPSIALTARRSPTSPGRRSGAGSSMSMEQPARLACAQVVRSSRRVRAREGLIISRRIDHHSISIDSENPDGRRIGQNARVMAVGRKNWLFAGSDHCVHRAASILSPVETAKLYGIEPEADSPTPWPSSRRSRSPRRRSAPLKLPPDLNRRPFRTLTPLLRN